MHTVSLSLSLSTQPLRLAYDVVCYVAPADRAASLGLDRERERERESGHKALSESYCKSLSSPLANAWARFETKALAKGSTLSVLLV